MQRGKLVRKLLGRGLQEKHSTIGKHLEFMVMEELCKLGRACAEEECNTLFETFGMTFMTDSWRRSCGKQNHKQLHLTVHEKIPRQASCDTGGKVFVLLLLKITLISGRQQQLQYHTLLTNGTG